MMSSPLFRNMYWDFVIENKVFVLHLTSNGVSVIISERKRFASFEMRVEVAAAVWMIDMLDEALDRGAVEQFV